MKTFLCFVFCIRYRNGNDHIGEHKDNEPDMDKRAPIVSLSLGQQREFVLKHGDVRKKGVHRRNVPLGKWRLLIRSLWLRSLIFSENGAGARQPAADESAN